MSSAPNSKEKVLKRCKCGFGFTMKMMLEEPLPFDSYAVVNDKKYKAFIKSGIKAWQGKEKIRRREMPRLRNLRSTSGTCTCVLSVHDSCY